MRRLSIVTVLFTLSGCHLYFGGDDDGDPCDFGGGSTPGAEADEAVPAVGQRNPETGQCEYFGGWDPVPCDDRCGPCPGGGGAQVPLPSWGYCESFCTGLDETTCQESPGCRAIYVDEGTGSEVYAECWSTDQTGPIGGGDCDGLDAYSCSLHDECSAVHLGDCPVDSNGLTAPGCAIYDFISCRDEGAEVTCFGEVLCDSLPPDCPDPNTVPGIADGCWTGDCIDVNDCEPAPPCEDIAEEATCIGMACQPLYEGLNCTCDVDGNCTCDDWLFTGCETPVGP